MIKFFRKIRQKLLTENKFSKYLLYAVGEVLLVVIGILIALQINNRNENKILRKEIKLNLENLTTAIKKDYELLNEIEINNDFRYKSLNQLLKLVEADTSETDIALRKLNGPQIWKGAIPDTFNVDFNIKTFTWINRPRKMVVNYYAMEEFKNAGIYSQLQNQKLKNLLSDYYSGLDWFFGGDDVGASRGSLDELNNYVRDNYQILMGDLPMLSDPIEVIKNDPAMIVRLRLVQGSAYWRMLGATGSKKEADNVLKEIALEISQH